MFGCAILGCLGDPAKLASIFLSYVREDVKRAAAIAAVLEGAHHSVWWDRYIKGGSEFSPEIERALNGADRIVVLWSEKSAASRWVRDEASVGAESGRLVPVTIDGTQPPLGFRQFHTIDLSRWNKSGQFPALDALLGALDNTASPPEGPPIVAVLGRREVFNRPKLIGAAVVLVLAAGGAVLLLREQGPALATVSIQSAGSDVASTAAARDLSIKLASIPAVSTGAFQLTSDSDGTKRAALVLQVGARRSATAASNDLALLKGKDHEILWAAHFEQPVTQAADLSAQLGVIAARVLACAADTLSPDGAKLHPSTAKRYLSACAKFAEEYDETTFNVFPDLQKVVAEVPSFAPAWAKLLYAEAIYNGGDPERPLQAQLGKHLAEAKRRGVDVPELHIGEAALLQSNDFGGKLSAIENAVKRDEQSAIAQLALAEALMKVGRQDEAVRHAMRASELDPISPRTLSQYAFMLAHSGNAQQALDVLQHAERLWPGANTVEFARFSFDLRYGDPRKALVQLRYGGARWGQQSVKAFLEARVDPTPGKIERAVQEQQRHYRQTPYFFVGLAQTLATFGRSAEAVQLLLDNRYPAYGGFQSEPLFRPYMAKVRADPRFMQAMANMGLVKYWQTSSKWPDFCFDPKLPYDCKEEAAKYRV